MKDNEPFIILLILFIIFGLAYGPIKKSGSNEISRSSGSSAIGGTQENLGYSSNKEVADTIKETEENIKKLNENINKEIEKNRRSPYSEKIRISGISGLWSDNPDQEYINLYTNLDKNEIVKITGWILKSEVTGYYATIGKAALLPFPFTKTESDIVLQQGDRVVITKGFSPIGISFRTNKCTGYFEEDRTFTPSLPLDCPRPDEETLPVFSSNHDRNEECIDIIKNISRCTTEGNEFIRDLPDTVTNSCKTYIKTQISYNSCVSRHYSDTNFPGNEYRIFLSKFGALWRKTHDKINLYDENGLIVDTISY